jgi:uncharacterized repeat protein (TIGR03803 family)
MGGTKMRIDKRFGRRLVMGISVFICIMVGLLENTSAAQAAPAGSILYSFGSVANDGAYPLFGSLAFSGSTLYGMTERGGASSVGTIFEINRSLAVNSKNYRF